MEGILKWCRLKPVLSLTNLPVKINKLNVLMVRTTWLKILRLISLILLLCGFDYCLKKFEEKWNSLMPWSSLRMLSSRKAQLAKRFTSEKEIATHSSTLAWKSHGRRSLVGYSPWSHKELDTTKRMNTQFREENEEAAPSSLLVEEQTILHWPEISEFRPTDSQSVRRSK